MLAHKLVRRNLSDIAAMGAAPLSYLVALMLPRDTSEGWFADFARGLAECQDMFGLTLLGGDTASTDGPLSMNLTAFGTVMPSPLLRSGARAGDALYVTGTLGDAAFGLDVLQGRLVCDDASSLIARYRFPEPRLAIGRALHGIATACMDISDGLIADAGHMARASTVALRIDASWLPLSAAASALLAADSDRLRRIISGGDDYELLFTAPDHDATREALSRLHDETGIAITRIGDVVSGEGVMLHDARGNSIALREQGYTHF
ncbi:MAG: thiamine-phosphate kinase [Alphaproteobacteria bacterium]|nr:thiamine-phosphate kinase [Alphaproteobacteria bacterium]